MCKVLFLWCTSYRLVQLHLLINLFLLYKMLVGGDPVAGDHCVCILTPCHFFFLFGSLDLLECLSSLLAMMRMDLVCKYMFHLNNDYLWVMWWSCPFEFGCFFCLFVWIYDMGDLFWIDAVVPWILCFSFLGTSEISKNWLMGKNVYGTITIFWLFMYKEWLMSNLLSTWLTMRVFNHF